MMVWGAIYRDQKGPLVVWDTPSWGRINGTTYVENIIRPHVYPWWHTLHRAGNVIFAFLLPSESEQLSLPLQSIFFKLL